MGQVSSWTLSNSYSLKLHQPRLHCQSLKTFTAHLFLYLVDFSTALSTQSSSSSIVFGKRNLPSAMAKKYVNHFKFTTLLEYKFGATRNYWIIKNKSSQIQWMWTEYNKSHTRHFEEKWKKIQHCIILYCFFGEDISKTRASGFIRFPNARKHLKPRGRRPRGFKSILAPFRAAIHVCLTFAQIRRIKKVWARVKR